MSLLLDLVAGGWMTAIALAFLLAETALLAYLARRGRPAMRLVWFNALAGVGLIGALHMALTGAGPAWVLAFLSLGLVGHLGDLWQRLR
jgi:hypothetical protein